MTEAGVLREFRRHLRAEIEKGARYRGVTFTAAIPDYPTRSGAADLVVETLDRAFLVIETTPPDGSHRVTGPYAGAVVGRAAEIAREIDAPYFATCDGTTCVVYETFEPGTSLPDRNYREVEVDSARELAPTLLDEVAKINAGADRWPAPHDAFLDRLGTVHGRLADELRTGPAGTHDRDVGLTAYHLLIRALVSHGSTDEIFDGHPVGPTARADIEGFLDRFDRHTVAQFDRDVIGRLYPRLVSDEERRVLGQYYTPPEVVDFLTRMTVLDADDTVLDPACGSGTFLVRAYNRLRSLGADPGHEAICSRLYGVDINPVPIRLAALNLAMQDPDTEASTINVERADFFDVDPGRPPADRDPHDDADTTNCADGLDDPVATDDADTSGSEAGRTTFPANVDAVLANPPYIRQESLDKDRCRAHLERDPGDVDIDERSDMYCYFFTHASEFLSENGRIGMITPDKWLTVGYGEDLREFFLDRFKIRAVVSFPSRVFEDALVPTCVILLERAADRRARRENAVKFVRLKEDVDLSTVERFVDGETPADVFRDEPTYRLVTKRQGTIRAGEKWDRYLRAPSIYWELLDRPGLVALSAVATIDRGVTTGANRFFYLSEAQADEWDIDDRFLEPLVKTVRGMDRPGLDIDDLDRHVLALHGYAGEISAESVRPRTRIRADLTRAQRASLTERERDVLEALLDDGYDGTYRYLRSAMWDREYQHGPPHERQTVQQYRRNRGLWFDLGKLEPGELLLSKEYWSYGTPLAILNETGAIADQQLYVVDTEHDPHVLGGILNSSWGALVRELHGRTTGGGMNRVAVYEAETLPVPDPTAIDGATAREIRESFGAMLAGEPDARAKLDGSVLAAIGAKRRTDEVRAYAEAFSKARREGKGVGAFVSNPGEDSSSTTGHSGGSTGVDGPDNRADR